MRTQWEYTTIRFDTLGFLRPKLDPTAFDAELNRLGQDGWELVSMMDLNLGNGVTFSLVATFKRPR